MTGIYEAINVATTSKTLPRVETYGIVLAPGSIMLVDLSAINWDPTGSATVIGNLAMDEAKALTGLTESNLRSFLVAGSQISGLKFERTKKGGFHIMADQATFHNSAYSTLRFVNNALGAWIKTNMTGHQYYLDIWSRLTRSAVINSASGQSALHMFGASDVFAVVMDTTGNKTLLTTAQAGGSLLSDTYLKDNTAGEEFRMALAGTLVSGAAEISLAHTGVRLRTLTAASAANGGATPYTGAPSFIMYNWYLEDLTASGRTAEEVDAIRKKQFQDAFAVGGVFYGDTWTDPSTVTFS